MHPITILCSSACTGYPNSKKPHLPAQGKITFNFDAEWLTVQRKKTIAQLVELGIDIYAPNG